MTDENQTSVRNFEFLAKEGTLPLQFNDRIIFDKSVPIYVVRPDLDTGFFYLERNDGGNDAGYPSRIEPGIGGILTIGRKDGLFPSPYISKQHAVLQLSQIVGTDVTCDYIAHEVPSVRSCKTVPLIGAQEALYESKIRLAENSEHAQKQLQTIQRLLKEIDETPEELQDIKSLEATLLESYSNADSWRDGASPARAQRGYRMWLEAIGVLYGHEMKEYERRSVQKMVQALTEITGELKDQADLHRRERPPYTTDVNPRYTALIKPLARKKLMQLIETGETYIATGNHEHHMMARIQRHSEGNYYLAIYNAGSEAPGAPHWEGTRTGVMGVYEQKVKPGINTTELIHALTKKRLTDPDAPEYAGICEKLHSMLEPQIIRYTAVNAQTRGNCTTCSTRLALQDALSDDTMDLLATHITDKNIDVKTDLRIALETRQKSIREWIAQNPEKDFFTRFQRKAESSREL